MVAECRRHETRIPAAERQRSGASPVSRNIASFEAHGIACVDDTPNRRQHRSSAEVDIWDRVSCLGRIYSNLPSVFGAVNLEHAGRPTLSQRTGA